MPGQADDAWTRTRRLLLTAAGLVSVGLGLLGAFLPLVPTTPFVLLAAYCFARSSPRLHHWLRRHEVLGPPLRDWEEHRAVSRSTKAVAITVLWVTIPLSMLLIPSTATRIVLAGVLLVATAILLQLDTLEAGTQARRRAPDG